MSLKLEIVIILSFSNVTWTDYKDWTDESNNEIWKDIRKPMQ